MKKSPGRRRRKAHSLQGKALAFFDVLVAQEVPGNASEQRDGAGLETRMRASALGSA
jgi:hypothetical protein